MTAGLSPQQSVVLFISLAVLVAALLVVSVVLGLRAHARKVATGREGLIGAVGTARSHLAPEGMVLMEGELWKARAARGTIPSGTSVQVVGMRRFLLTVEPEAAEMSANIRKEET